MQALIIYSTTDGQTQKISESIKDNLKYSTQMINIKEVNSIDLNDYGLIIIGASIRYGHFSRDVYKFIESHHEYLNKITTAFFSVNLTARKEEKNTPETNAYTRKFLEKVKWQPTKVEVFAGALRYPRYSFFDKYMIKLIMKITGGETNTTKEIEYTDWAKVKTFAQSF